jgi:predicted SAM-dependent methyltransferase
MRASNPRTLRRMLLLNLGCGTKASPHPDVVNIDWSMYLRLSRRPLLRRLALMVLNETRRERLLALPSNVQAHNIAKGIPFDDHSVDVVYHSHLLEHLDRDVAERFMHEVRRVLRGDGIQRIVVPDLEAICRDYLDHLQHCADREEEWSRHDEYVAALIEQSVRRDAYGSSQQRPIRRYMENAMLGDARRRGETHQWMYDRINLSALLTRTGFGHIERQRFNTSGIPRWMDYGLDVNINGNEHKPGSLYLEARPT